MDKLARAASNVLGSSRAFAFALGFIGAWALMGPLVGYSDSWQLTINTSTTIVTFLATFLIQYTTNKDTTALHKKLDEMIRVDKDARNALIGIEQKSDDEIRKL